MPQERDNPFPFPIASEVEEAPGSREIKSARNVMVRNIPGIPRRAYLMGESDHAPILQGVAELTTACWNLLDAIPEDQLNGTVRVYVDDLKTILTHHGCPEERPKVTL